MHFITQKKERKESYVSIKEWKQINDLFITNVHAGILG